MKKRLSNRKIGFKEVKKPILIVCEDSKSSVFYLREKIRDLYISPIDIEVDGKSNSSPISVVDYAIKRKKEKSNEARKNGIEEYDKVYCVMDVDEHPSLKQAIQKARANHLVPIVSNQCFELWYLLHFRSFSTSSRHRRDIEKELTDLLGKGYDKGDKTLYQFLKTSGNEASAISLAKRLKSHAEEVSDERDPLINPSTAVFELMEVLNKIAGNNPT